MTNAGNHIDYLKHSFDCWSGKELNMEISEFFNKFFSNGNYESGKVGLYQNDLNIFRECCDNHGEYSDSTGRNRKFPLNKILLLFSINTYLQKKDRVTEDQFRRRIRIIRNLIWNSSYEIRDEYMEILLSESNEIILTGDIPVSDRGYNKNQKEEERRKIEWLKTNPKMRDALFNLEEHLLLKGCVAIVGLNNSDNFNKFKLLFDNCDRELITRALLTIGDYSQSIKSRSQIGAKNDSVWISLFHPSDQRPEFNETSKILNTLLSRLDESDINNKNLEKIIEEYISNPYTQKDWRYYLIKYNQMELANHGMYYCEDRQNKPYEILIMKETTLGGRNWNVFLNTLCSLPDFAGKVTLGEYARQGDRLRIINSDIFVDCLNEKYVVSGGEKDVKEYSIAQPNGIDSEDRIEMGKKIITDLLM